MGLFDKFRGDSDTDNSETESEKASKERNAEYTESEDYEADYYSEDELGDEISVIFADRWPTGKEIGQFELIYAVDPGLTDPILLRCAQEFFMPKGTKLLPFGDTSGINVEGRMYWATYAQLINPELASFIDYDWEYKAPESMEGHRIAPREPDEGESELLNYLLTSLEVGGESDSDN